ncbi:MAG TPA: hypothetical protein EYO05_00680 [Gammaproteobacteria bacterium]|nr:hypothetical protein [Gammaproteobacteria bacterium]
MLFFQSDGRHFSSLLDDASFLLISRFAGKALLFVFLIVLAKRLNKGEFLDLEVISSLFNFLIWLFLAVTFSISRIGSSFPVLEVDKYLRVLLKRTLPATITLGGLILTIFLVSGLLYNQTSGSVTVDLVLIVSAFALLQFLFSYILGFHQARESYRFIGVLYLVPGLVAVVPAGLFLFLDLGLLEALMVYLLGAICQLLLAYIGLHSTILKSPATGVTDIPKKLYPGLIRISLGLSIFFVIHSMDIFSAKFLLDQASGETYARLEFLGRILFTIVATVGFVAFVRFVRAYEDEKPFGSIVRSFSSSKMLVGLGTMIGIFLCAPFLYTGLFSDDATALLPVMFMVLSAKTIQSILFIVVTFKGATVSRYVLRWLVVTLGLQVFLFATFHDDISDVARNILISAVVATALFCYSFLRERRAAVTHAKQ